MAAPRQETVRVDGLREFMRATAKAEKDTKKLVRARLREAGESVRIEAKDRFSRISAESASKFKVRARAAGVFVEQSARKTTGLRPDYGSLQMTRALIPALELKADEVTEEVAKAADELRDMVEGRGAYP